MSKQEQINEIEVSKKTATKMVGNRDAILRLMKNRDFKRVILDTLFEKEPVRLVLLKSDPNFQTDEQQAELEKEMLTIGGLRQFLNSQIQMGNQMADSLEDMDKALEELRAEDDSE